MAQHSRPAILALLGFTLAACAARAGKPLVDPVRFALPLVEDGSLEIDGRIVGQPRARNGVVYCATRDGSLSAVVIRSRSVLWRFRAGHTLSRGPELGEGRVVLLDDSGTVYVLGRDGAPVLAKRIEGTVTTAVREKEGRVYFGTAEGAISALDIASGGTPAWDFRDPASGADVTAGPVFAGELVLFGRSDGRLLAFDSTGRLVWERRARGAIRSDPAFDRGRIHFGTEERVFYCLKASNGRKVWSRRLQGAPLGPAVAGGRRLAFAASNSVVFLLARRGGSIISWAAVPSRIVHEPAAAGAVLLLSSAEQGLAALDFETGEKRGQHATAGPLTAGALWAPPFVVLFEEDAESGRQRMVVLSVGPVEKPGRLP